MSTSYHAKIAAKYTWVQLWDESRIVKRSTEASASTLNAVHFSPQPTNTSEVAGCKKKDIKCILIANTDPNTLRLEEAKYIKTIGHLNDKSSVYDEEKAKKRELKFKIEGKKPKQCECGGHWTYGHKKRHFCSIQHQKFLQKKNSSLAKNIFSTNTINDKLDRTCKKDSKEEQNKLQGSNECSQTNIQTKKIKFDQKSKIFVIQEEHKE